MYVCTWPESVNKQEAAVSFIKTEVEDVWIGGTINKSRWVELVHWAAGWSSERQRVCCCTWPGHVHLIRSWFVLSKGSRLTWSRNRICLSARPAHQPLVCPRSRQEHVKSFLKMSEHCIYIRHKHVTSECKSLLTGSPVQDLLGLNPACLSVPARGAEPQGQSCQRKLKY